MIFLFLKIDMFLKFIKKVEEGIHFLGFLPLFLLEPKEDTLHPYIEK